MSNTDTAISFIPGLENESELLLLPDSALDLFDKFAALRDSLPGVQLIVSRLVSTPIVVDFPGRPSIEMMSHPLVWLGERQRFALADDDGTVESLNHHALRVALELTMANLYTPGVGWVDCLSLMGLDAERDAERLQAWIDGAPDDLLDNFTLDEYLNDANDLALSFDMASEQLDGLMDISLGLMARSIARSGREVLEGPEAEWTNDERRLTMAFLATLADTLIGGSVGPLPDYADRIGIDTDATISDSFSWEFVHECERLAEQYEKVADKIVADFDAEAGERDAATELKIDPDDDNDTGPFAADEPVEETRQIESGSTN